MILPNPESDLSLNLMVIGTDIISYLKQKGKREFILIETVMESFLKQDEKRTPDMFVNTLSFLYSVGMIEQKDYKIKLVVRQYQQTTLFI
jgi:hypothetical protein